MSLAEDLALSHAGSALSQPLGLRGSCGNGGDFYCLAGSARCRHAANAAASVDRMARPANRAQFLFCATRPCQNGCILTRSGPKIAGGRSATVENQSYSRYAVGRLLAMWLEVGHEKRTARGGERTPGRRARDAAREFGGRRAEPPPTTETVERNLEAIASRLLREERAAGGEAWAAARADASCLPRERRVGWCGQPSSASASGCTRGSSGRWHMAELTPQGVEALAAACEQRCRGCARCR